MRLKTKKKRAARPDRCAAGTATNASQPEIYRTRTLASRKKLLLSAGDVLLLLQFRLSRLERLAYWQLFERRLRDAYMEAGA